MVNYPWPNLHASDIETTGLLHMMEVQENPHLWNLGSIEFGTKKETCYEYTDRASIQAFLDTGPTLVMHNGMTFDKEALAFLGFDVSKVTIIDTLYISWYLWPKKVIHGLAAYGEEFDVPKPAIEDWENQTQEEYNHRVMMDCRIQHRLWEEQYAELLEIYRSPAEVKRFVEYLMSKARQQVIQQRCKWKLNIPKAEVFQKKVIGDIEAKVVVLEAAMPKIADKAIKSPPAKRWMKSGKISSAGTKWKAICDANGLDWLDDTIQIEYIKGYTEPNAGSHVQIKDWLYSMGWVPQTFKFVRNKETGETRNIPQITIKDDDDLPDICQSVKDLAEKFPESGLEHLIGLGVLKHRKSVVDGFLRNHVNGYLTARCAGLTNTLRLKHSELVNLPSTRVLYGEELRDMLEAPEGYELLGSDLASLEDRCKHHFQWQYDPEYVKKQLAPDYDAHLAIGVAGGFITEEQSQRHKDGIEKVRQRPIFKTTNYACQYGAGAATVARSAKCEFKVGEQLWKAYWKLNWSIKEISANTTVNTVRTKMWQRNPVNGFWYSLRNDKDRFSTLCQGTGAYVFDVWCQAVIDICNERWGRDPMLLGQFHDELILQVKKGTQEIWKGVMVESMARTNKILKMNRDVAIDVQFGDTYSHIH